MDREWFGAQRAHATEVIRQDLAEYGLSVMCVAMEFPGENGAWWLVTAVDKGAREWSAPITYDNVHYIGYRD